MFTLGPSTSEIITQSHLTGQTGANLIPEGPQPEKIERKIDDSKIVEETGKKVDETWEERIFDYGRQFVGWGVFIKNLINSDGTINITETYSTFLNVADTMKSFDWNATDKQLEATLKAQDVALASAWGGALGVGASSLVGVSIGRGVGMSVPRIGSAQFSQQIYNAVKEEALDNFQGDWTAALNVTKQQAVSSTAVKGYMMLRTALKTLPNELLSKYFSESQVKFIKEEWGQGIGGQITFNSFMDETIEKIESPALEAFAEEFVDEFWDNIVDLGYVICRELDDGYRAVELERLGNGGDRTTVRLNPNEEAIEENWDYIDMPRQELIQAIQDDLREYQRMQGRNVGQIVSSSFQESVRTRPMLRQMVIRFCSKEKPPWVHDDGKAPKYPEIRIPDYKPGLTWNQIKKAAKAFTWGPFRAQAILTNRRQLAVYGQSQAEAVAKLKDIQELSTVEILRLSCSEELETPTKQKKEPILVYPYSCKLLFRQNSLDNNGNIVIDNKYYDTDFEEFLLWPDDEPQNMPTIL